MKLRMSSGMYLLIILGFLNFSDKAIIGLAAGPMIAEFRLTPSQWGSIGSAFFALFSISSVVAPFLALRLGTKRLLFFLALIWAFVQFLTIPIKSFFFLFGSRVVLGATEGPFYGLSVHLAGVWTPSERRGVAFGALTLGSALGPAFLSPILALLIVEVGWRGTFAFLGILGLLWCIIWRCRSHRLVDTLSATKAPMRIRSSLLCLLNPQGIFTMLSGFGGYWYLALLVAWMPQYFTESRHLAPSSALYGLAVSFPWLGGALMQVLANFISDRLWRSTHNVRLARVVPLTFCLVLGAILLGLATVVPSPLESIICLFFSPIGAVFPLVAVILGEMVPKSSRGQAQGMGVAVYSLAGLIAPVITGLLIQRIGSPVQGFAVAFLFGASIIAILGFLCWIFVRNLPLVEEEELSLAM